MTKNQNKIFNNLQHDIPAGLTVFLVAMPLCLGIALASGVPLISGLVTGIVGGLIVSLISDSQLSVSGPAAGLTAIVLSGIHDLGGLKYFLGATIFAGAIQILLGIFKLGNLSKFVPESVIEGMMASIGIILILKQWPHLIGRDLTHPYQVEASIIGGLCFATLFLWDKFVGGPMKKIPPALVVVGLGILIGYIFHEYFITYEFDNSYLVHVPQISSWEDFKGVSTFVDWSKFSSLGFFKITITIAIVASLETLLSITAVDRIDHQKRQTNRNRELMAQGVGNVVSGFLGGLPMTSVIVRSSVNINSGGKTKASAFIHGLFLLLSVIVLTKMINTIPIVSLSSILVYTGYKLANPKLAWKMIKLGLTHAVPFFITILFVLINDLLVGIFAGMLTHYLLIRILKKQDKNVHQH